MLERSDDVGCEMPLMINRRDFIRSAVSTATMAGASAMRMPAYSGWTHGRPFSWSDAANRTNVEHAVIAGDGNAVALQVARPLSAGGKFLGPAWTSLLDSRADLWMLDEKLAHARPFALLPGGAWSPWFSPDGKRLSALTLVGPGRVGVVVWELSRGTYRILSEPNVEIFLAKFRTGQNAYGAPTDYLQVPRQYLWLDENSILLVDRGTTPPLGLLTISSLSSTVEANRQRTQKGLTSVRVWDERSPTCGATSRLVKMAVDTGKIDTLLHGDVRGVSLSPSRRWLAVMMATRNIPPVPDRPMRWPLLATSGGDDAMVELKLMLLDLTLPISAQEIAGVIAVGNVAPSRLPQWSADSSRVAVPVRTTYSDAPSTGNDNVWEFTLGTASAQKWAASSALDAELLATLLTTEGLNTKAVLDRRPQNIRPEAYGNLVGQIKGGAWCCTPRQVMFWNAPTLTLISCAGIRTLPHQFTSVQPPVLDDFGSRTVAVRADGRNCLITAWDNKYCLDVLSTEPQWNILAINPRGSSVIYKNEADSGSFLIIARPGKRTRKSPLTFNTYFRGVARPRRRMLTCTFPDGSVRSGLLQLPIGHRPGDRHPVIVWAYPNSAPTISGSLSRVNSLDSVIYPVQYLLTQGFAFFQAPFPIRGTHSFQPMQAAVDAVIPWLDVLARQPEIVSECYGFFGHSNAGYVALALEAMTNRFRAIVAWATFPELGYDTLHSFADDSALNCAANIMQADRALYEDPTQPYTPQPAPPWRRPIEYIRNDPLFRLQQASTPLLLVEGEFDDDPREMEQVYSILYGSGVPVELAYYWGEDHVFASPGNIYDCWLRTERFLRQYLKAG